MRPRNYYFRLFISPLSALSRGVPRCAAADNLPTFLFESRSVDRRRERYITNAFDSISITKGGKEEEDAVEESVE